MAFDDDSFEVGCLLRDGVVVFGRDGFGVEEAAAVVELDLTGWGELGEGVVDLGGDGSDGYGFGEGVLPEIAHEAAPGALAVGEEEGGYGDDFFCGGVLLFYEEGVGAVGVELVALRTLGRIHWSRSVRFSGYGDGVLIGRARGTACGTRLRGRGGAGAWLRAGVLRAGNGAWGRRAS